MEVEVSLTFTKKSQGCMLRNHDFLAKSIKLKIQHVASLLNEAMSQRDCMHCERESDS